MNDSIELREMLLVLLVLCMMSPVGCKDGNSDGLTDSTIQPEITSISPVEGPIGTAVTIQGSGFSPTASENEVSFGGTPSTVSSAASSAIQTTVPEGATSGTVSVVVNGNTASGPVFTVVEEMPGIETVEPDSGTVGTEIVINGMNFSAVASENTVTFNGTLATVSSATETELVTSVPEGATDGPLEVTVDGETATFSNFDVVTTGTLEVNISTSGSKLDPNGYLLNVLSDFVEIDTMLAINEQIYLSNLEEAIYRVELKDIASNCDVLGPPDNPRGITVPAGDTTFTNFVVECSSEPTNGKIAFATNREGNYEIYLMNPDGSDQTPFTSSSGNNITQSWSPDGSKIAFSSTRDGQNDIFVKDVNGINSATNLTNSLSYDLSPSWSPDGTKIAFQSDRDGPNDIFVMNADGTNPVRITDGNTDGDSWPRWSPDGSQIAFFSNRDGDNEIFVMDADGTNPRQLTSNTIADTAPAWSPDGTKIAYSSGINESIDIYVRNADGSGAPTNLTNNSSANDLDPSWSPDGTKIVFLSQRDGNNEIYVMNADGTSVTRLTDDPDSDTIPSWGPSQ